MILAPWQIIFRTGAMCNMKQKPESSWTVQLIELAFDQTRSALVRIQSLAYF